jgi:hypothetical protein
MPPTTRRVAGDVRQSPIYWFFLLDRAIQDGDFEAAVRAQRELKCLGVEVRYRRPAGPNRGGPGHAA